ncbi:MAG: helix-turn-helix transcriptional regulator [Myxococcales bacterium]|nr:helix-turn-helix transcriptional regulator [Myxococcales bacterium]
MAELRTARGLTQAEFSEQIGITTKHLQKIELGELNMTIRSLTRLADHLDVGIGALFDAPRSRHVRRGRPPRDQAP